LKARVFIPRAVEDILAELPEEERESILAKLHLLERFPRMYPVAERSRFRRHRRFLGRDWVVYYRVVGNTVYVRGLWPARIP
jgi:mRNA-degrading endonuclease RelE of RelBE toxin-antitoxin system